jgi:hypothetical protein
MKELNRIFFLVIVINFSVFVSYGQNIGKVVVYTENCNQLIAGINNYITIMAMQDSSLSVEQISAYLIIPTEYEMEPIKLDIEKRHDKFLIRPDSIGLVEIHVKLNNHVEIERIRVKPLKAVCRLSNYKANSETKISAGELKAQLGIIANVECCGFEAKCKMLEFEVVRIPLSEISSRVINKGGRFEDNTLGLINQAETGDLYIFKNIYYRCPSSEKQRSEDMIIEIK